MFSHRVHGTNLGVAGWCHFEVYLPVTDKRREWAQDEFTVVELGISVESNSVPNAVSAMGECVRNQLEVGWLTCMNRHIDMTLAGDGESVCV